MPANLLCPGENQAPAFARLKQQRLIWILDKRRNHRICCVALCSLGVSKLVLCKGKVFRTWILIGRYQFN